MAFQLGNLVAAPTLHPLARRRRDSAGRKKARESSEKATAERCSTSVGFGLHGDVARRAKKRGRCLLAVRAHSSSPDGGGGEEWHPEAAEGDVNTIDDKRKETTYSLNRRISYLVASASSKRSGRRLTPYRAAKEASAILSHMERSYDADPKGCKIRPDAYTYTAVVDAWAKSRARDAARRAERILERMETYAEGSVPGYSHVRPNAVTFGAVINGWAKSADRDGSAPFRAEKVLRKLEELYEESQDESCRPNTRCYNAAIDAWVRRTNGSSREKDAGAASRAHAILRKMEQLRDGGANEDAAPDSFSYSSVVNAYSRVGGPDGAAKAESLIRKMEGLYADDPFGPVKPNSFAYTALINAYARTEGGGEEAALRAEEVLRHMVELRRNGTNPEAEPNVYTYQGVLLAWANSDGGVKAAKRAESILRHMHRLYDAGNRSVRPLTMCYNTVLQAWADSGGGTAAAERAESILWSMTRVPFSSSNNATTTASANDNTNSSGSVPSWPDVFPDTASVNSCMQAWARSGADYAAERVERLLLRGFDRLAETMPSSSSASKFRPPPTVGPDIVSYNTAINAHVQSGKAGSSARAAESILYRLIELEGARAKQRQQQQRRGGKGGGGGPHLQRRGGGGVLPNVQSFAGVINLWCKSDEPGSAERAETLLDKMETLHREGGNPYVKPGVVIYTTVLSAWARDKTNPHRGRRAQAIFDRMQALASAADDPDLQANSITYNALLHVWSVSGEADAGERAESLLREMERECEKEEGDNGGGDGGGGISSDVLPTARTYNYVMKCISNSCEDKAAAAERVHELLEVMLEKFQGGGNIFVRPDSYTFAAVVDALAESGTRDAGTRILRVLRRMEALYDGGVLTSGPHSIIYNRAIRFFYDQDDAAAATRILLKMEEYGSDPRLRSQVRPDGRTYAAVLSMFAKSSRGEDPTAARRALEILDRMKRLGFAAPSSLHYNTVITCLARSHDRKSAEKALALFEEMKRSYEEGNMDAKPDTATYLNLINALARSGQEDDGAAAGDEALSLLEEFLNDADLKPERAVFNACLNALSKGGTEESALRAEGLLRRMERLHERGGRYAVLKPDKISYTSCLQAWAASARAGAGKGGPKTKAPERAEQVLMHMEDLYEAGNDRVRPDAVAYNTVLRAWALCGADDKEGSGASSAAVEHAERILAHMKSQYGGGNAQARPDSYTYKIMLTTHASNGSPKTAEKYLNLMEGEYAAGDMSMKPDLDCFKACSSAWEAKGATDKTEALARRLSALYRKDNK